MVTTLFFITSAIVAYFIEIMKNKQDLYNHSVEAKNDFDLGVICKFSFKPFYLTLAIFSILTLISFYLEFFNEI